MDKRAEGSHFQRAHPPNKLNLLPDDGQIDDIRGRKIKLVSHKTVQQIALQLEFILSEKLPVGFAADVDLFGLGNISEKLTQNIPSWGASK